MKNSTARSTVRLVEEQKNETKVKITASFIGLSVYLRKCRALLSSEERSEMHQQVIENTAMWFNTTSR